MEMTEEARPMQHYCLLLLLFFQLCNFFIKYRQNLTYQRGMFSEGHSLANTQPDDQNQADTQAVSNKDDTAFY